MNWSRRTILLGFISLASVAVTGCGANRVSTAGPPPVISNTQAPAQADTIPLAAQPVIVLYGTGRYTLPVPAAEVPAVGGLTAGDVPGGILWLTPPGFPDVTAHPISDWSLWFTPSSTAGGSLWTGALLWQTFPKGQTPRLLGVTDRYAIIHLTEGDQTQVVAVGLTDGRTRSVAQYAAASEAQRQFGYGVYAWLDTDNHVHIVNLATADEQTVPLTEVSGKPYLQIVPGGVTVGGKTVQVSLVETLPEPVVPATYKWIGNNGHEIAVPADWIVREIPGGSSRGVSATNPQDPNQKVTLMDNGCAGCYLPDPTAGARFASFSSPFLRYVEGETYSWLDSLTVSYTLPPDSQNPYPTYGVTRTFSQRSGTREAQVTMPAESRQTATTILNSMLSQP